jgi:hypothetical protein
MRRQRFGRDAELAGMLKRVDIYEQSVAAKEGGIGKVSRQQLVEAGTAGFAPDSPTTFTRLAHQHL